MIRNGKKCDRWYFYPKGCYWPFCNRDKGFYIDLKYNVVRIVIKSAFWTFKMPTGCHFVKTNLKISSFKLNCNGEKHVVCGGHIVMNTMYGFDFFIPIPHPKMFLFYIKSLSVCFHIWMLAIGDGAAKWAQSDYLTPHPPVGYIFSCGLLSTNYICINMMLYKNWCVYIQRICVRFCRIQSSLRRNIHIKPWLHGSCLNLLASKR